MKLSELVSPLGVEVDDATEVEGVVVDSRKVKKGDVFVAYFGVAVDGHDYVNQAIANGAVAIIGERDLKLEVPYFRVENGRLAWAILVAKLHGNPEKKLKLIGVTGTDGKTTTTNLIYSILKEAGKKVGTVSTIVAKIGKTEVETGLHTSSPDPDILWPLLKTMVEEKCEYGVLEVTSHALVQDRFGNIKFEVGVLTNLTSDHLEFHKTVEEYAKAKSKLFSRSKTSIINGRARLLEIFKEAAKGRLVVYDREKEISEESYEVVGERIKQSFKVVINGKKMVIKSWLLGEYNQENILAAIKTAIELGLSNEEIKKGIESLEELTGRMQFVKNSLGINAVVDFAHTENAMLMVLRLVKEKLIKKGERLIVVFGCNGQRDRSKRAPMGKVACTMADLVVITTEDPRKESVDQIFSDMQGGCDKGGGVLNKNYFRVDDRKEAIEKAVSMARKGDYLLCLGKGHEKSMNINGVETEWDEAAILKGVLESSS